MTDERIKDLFESYAKEEISQKVLAFGTDVGIKYPSDYEGAKHEGYGFYAGFRAAERLTKIEALEEVIKLYGYDIGGKAMAAINRMISELKEGE